MKDFLVHFIKWTIKILWTANEAFAEYTTNASTEMIAQSDNEVLSCNHTLCLLEPLW